VGGGPARSVLSFLWELNVRNALGIESLPRSLTCSG
jgi:hypothetical protein